MTHNIDTLLQSPRWYWLAGFTALCHGIAVCLLADALPKYDDLNDVFGFFRQLALAHTTPTTVAAFFYPNNEHVTATNHLIYFLQFRLLGELHFLSLVWLGHLIILCTAILLGCCLPSHFRPFAVAVMTLAYTNLHSWDSSFKVMTALSNQSVILFAVASLFALHRCQRLWPAILLAYAATFSQGNGMLLWPIGLLALLWMPQSRWQRACWWLLHAGLAIACYRWAHHAFPHGTGAVAASLLAQLQTSPTLPLSALLALLGSTAFDNEQLTLAMLTGSLGLGVLWLVRGTLRQQPLLLSLLLFIVGSAAMASVLRALATGDASGAMESRYRMYSLAFVPLILLLGVTRASGVHRTAIASVTLAVAAAMHASGYRHIEAIQSQTERFRQSYAHWLVDGDFRRQAIYFPPMSDHLLFVAHHWQLLDLISLPDIPQATLATTSDHTPCLSVSTHEQCPFSLSHRGNAIALSLTTTLADMPPSLHVTLCQGQQAQVTLTTPHERPGSAQQWLVPESAVPPGEYRVLWQHDAQTPCETKLLKKPRKVAGEMQALFTR